MNGNRLLYTLWEDYSHLQFSEINDMVPIQSVYTSLVLEQWHHLQMYLHQFEVSVEEGRGGEVRGGGEGRRRR